MKYRIRKIVMMIAVMCVVITAISWSPREVYAASGNVSIAVSASQLNVGDTLSVTITVSSDAPIGAYSMAVSYDSSVLEYTGGDGNGGGGTVSIAGYGDGSATRLSANLSFRAIANGSSAIATSGNDAYAYDETLLSMSHASTRITVTAPTTQAPTTQSTTADGPAASTSSTETTEVKDTSLKSLEISPGTLVPAFSPSVTNYSVELPEDTTSIIVSALAKDPTASVTVTHNNDLEPGFNRSYIVVTATNGAQTTYVLNITCGEVKEPEELAVLIDGMKYQPVSAEDMAGVTIPTGFTETTIEYENQELTAYETPDHSLQLVYLLNDQEEGSWFIYDDQTKEFYPYIEVPVVTNRYVILRLPQGITVPNGYTPVDLNINGQSVTAYARNAQDEIVLVYASNYQNAPAFYLYDKTESTFLRYLEQTVIENDTTEEMTTEEAVISEPDTVEEESVTESEKFSRVRTLLYIVCGITVILLIVLVILIRMIGKQANASESTLPEESGLPEKPSLLDDQTLSEEQNGQIMSKDKPDDFQDED
ncbi:MAG: cadherin-like beta sandwich domain-containing protein [Lachnospiraceae bacterium]|nr:cadherin-like beta sandwich domain-containing protein [Lachnospiraceae bacterium]